METQNKQLRRLLIVILVIALLGFAYLYVAGAEPRRPDVPLETLEEVFIDIDGDGDLDYVHSIQFVRQRVPLNPYPAPIQPGQ